jgi:hypothetical protein
MNYVNILWDGFLVSLLPITGIGQISVPQMTENNLLSILKNIDSVKIDRDY